MRHPLDSDRCSVLTRATPAMLNPKQAPCRWRSVAGPAIALPIAVAAWWHWRHPWMLTACAIAGLCLLCAVSMPRIWRPVQHILDLLAHAVSMVVSYTLLGILFLTCFVPGRCLLVVSKSDPLRRRKTTDGKSYWETLPPTPAGQECWRRQF